MYTGYAADFRQIVRAIASFISIYSNVSESAVASSQSLTTKKVARRSSHARLSLPLLCESSPQGKLNDSVQPGNVQLRSSSRSQLLVLFILQMFSGSGAVQGKCYRFAARPGTKPFSVGGAAAAAEAEAYSQTPRESLYLSRVVPRQPHILVRGRTTNELGRTCEGSHKQRTNPSFSGTRDLHMPRIEYPWLP
jgi:hypothetical protein